MGINGFSSRVRFMLVLLGIALGFALSACTGNTPPPVDPPPAGTLAKITILTSAPQKNALVGRIYGRVGTTALGRTDMTFQNQVCDSKEGSNSCQLQVKVGQIVTLVATDNANIEVGYFPYVNPPPDDRGAYASAQFMNWSQPCATPARGVCTFKVTGDQTVSAQFKILNLTTVSWVGVNQWKMTLKAQPHLGIATDNTSTEQNETISWGNPKYHDCTVSNIPTICWYIHTPDNATVKFEALPALGPVPVGSSGQLEFVRWGQACEINKSNPSCELTTGFDSSVTFYYEYLECPAATGGTFVSSGDGYKYEPYTDGCKVVRP